MGNSIGRRKKAKVMKISGETMKLKTPVKAEQITKDHPGHVLLDSEAVKSMGLRAKPLDPGELLEPKKVYFLLELPKLPEEEGEEKTTNPAVTRRVKSAGIHMSAKDRLEALMLSRRTVSDLSTVRPPVPGGGPVRVKMRLPRAQLDRLVEESKDEGEVAERIIGLYAGNSSDEASKGGAVRRGVKWKPEICEVAGADLVPSGRRVSFVPDEGEINLAASCS